MHSDDVDAPRAARAVTLKDIATHCGVSITAVSATLAGRPTRFTEATKERILRAAAELGYDPTRTQNARRLVLSRFGRDVLSHLIGLTFPPYFYRATYYSTIFQGIMDVLNDEGFGVLTLDPTVPEERLLPPSFIRGEVDGAIILVGWDEANRILTKLRTTPGFATRPVVSLMTELPDCAAVLVDAQAGAYALADHLLTQGHRRMLYFRRPGNLPFGFHQDQQYPGYRQACLAHGLDPEETLVPIDIDPAFWRLTFIAENNAQFMMLNTMNPGLHPVPSSAWQPLLKLLLGPPRITAILAPNDPMAIVLRYLLYQEGMRVPEDISLVGFDDTDPLLDAHGHNFLTTVRLPLRAMGREAARLLIDQLLGRPVKDLKRVIPATPCLRRSTAPWRLG